MKVLPDHTLLKILHDEEEMEDYLHECRDKPSSIDPIIWQVHLSAPAKKRMPVLNRFLELLIKKYSLVFSFLPDHMVLTRVYKILNIPFNVQSSKTSAVDLISCKKLTKNARLNRFTRIYNSWQQTKRNPDLGIYEYKEERSGPFVSFAEFRKEYNGKKSDNVSAADILSQLSKSKTKEKLVSSFASYNTQFLSKNSNQPSDPRISARVTDWSGVKQTKTVHKSRECNLLKKRLLPKKCSFKIFKSKDRPRLDVLVKTKHSDSASSHLAAPRERVSSGSFPQAPEFLEFCSRPTSSKNNEVVFINRTNIENRSTSSDNLLEMPNPPESFIESTSSKNDEMVSPSRMDVENCPKSKEIQIEVDSSSEETPTEQNLNNNESTSVNLNQCAGENLSQLCSDESVSVIQPTPVDENICSSNSSEPVLVYSSNRSEGDEVSIECSTDAEGNAAEFFDQPDEDVVTLSPVRKKSSQSHFCYEHLFLEQSKETKNSRVISDFDQLHKRSPLKIERKENSTSLKAKRLENSSAFDGLHEECENQPDPEIWETEGECEKNIVSESETSKASPSLVHSVIYEQRSSESESEEITIVSATSSPSVSRRDESIEHSPAQPASDIVYISQGKADSQSRNSTPERRVVIVKTAVKRRLRLESTSSTSESVSDIVMASPKQLHSQSRKSTPEQPASKIVSASKEIPGSPKSCTLEKPVSKTVSVSQENLRPQSKISTPEPPAPETISVTNEVPCSPSKNSSAKHPESTVTASQESSGSQLKKPLRKKTNPLNLSKAGKESKARADSKKVKKLTDFVAFSVRKRQASNFELAKSLDPVVILRKTKSPCSSKSTPRSTSIWSPSSCSAGSQKIRRVKKLFNESENYLSPSLVKKKPPAEVDSPGSQISKSPSPLKNADHSEMEKSTDSTLSPKLHSTCTAYRQSREVTKLLIESEEPLPPTKDKPSTTDFDQTMAESLSCFEYTGDPEMEKSSDSDSSSIILSRDFKTLSLASKKSSILFPSQSSKMSPTRGEVTRNSPASNLLNSQFSTEITLEQVDRMMEGIIPNESADSSFRFDLPSQFTFTSTNSVNNDKFGDLSPSSTLEKTLAAKEFPDQYSISSSDEETVHSRNSSNLASVNTSYPASRSTNGNFSSLYSLEVASDEDTNDEFSDQKILESFSIRESSIAKKKSKKFLSLKFSDGLPNRRHCISLPTGSKSAGRKKGIRKKLADVVDIDYSSDEDVFRDDSFRSLPTQLKKKSSLSTQQFKRKYQNKENQIAGKMSQQNSKKVVREVQKSPHTVSAKSQQFSNREKKKMPILSQKSSRFVDISDDDYESDELNTALNDSLTQFNERKKNKDVPESDIESTTSQYFDEDIAKLLTEYAALNAEQRPLSLSSNLSNSESTTFMSTFSVKSASSHKSCAPSRKPVTSGASNYKEIMWNSYPDSLETALTTPEQKLEEVRNNLREKAINSNSQKLFSSSQKSKSSKENESDSFGFLDWE